MKVKDYTDYLYSMEKIISESYMDAFKNTPVKCFYLTRFYKDGSRAVLGNTANTTLYTYNIIKRCNERIYTPNIFDTDMQFYIVKYIVDNLSQAKYRKLFSEKIKIHEDLGCGNPFNLQVKGEQYTDMFTYFSEPGDNTFITFCINNLDMLQQHHQMIYDDGASLIEIASNNRLLSAWRESENIVKKDEDFVTPIVDATHKARNCPEQLGMKKLSKREAECLLHIIKGFTDDKISENLGLSINTIHSYVENLKYKLHCNTRKDLISIGFKLGLVQLNCDFDEKTP